MSKPLSLSSLSNNRLEVPLTYKIKRLTKGEFLCFWFSVVEYFKVCAYSKHVVPHRPNSDKKLMMLAGRVGLFPRKRANYTKHFVSVCCL